MIYLYFDEKYIHASGEVCGPIKIQLGLMCHQVMTDHVTFQKQD